MEGPRLLFVVNDLPYFFSHRLPIARAAISSGFQVHIAGPTGPMIDALGLEGIVFHPLPITRSGTNPLSELRTVLSVFRTFRRLRPTLVHLVNMKPVIYGGIAARLAKVPALVSAVSGLGSLFSTNEARFRTLRLVALTLIRIALQHRNQRVIVQNRDDEDTLVHQAGMHRGKSVLIRGSGVDLAQYRPNPEPGGSPVITMASRLLRDKGVIEFVEAARLLRARGLQARFWLIGEHDAGNPNSVSPEEVEAWRAEGIVECLGFRVDIAELFALTHIVALPSYYGEGLPKVLIEAAACGRPIVTTDMPGCRDAVRPGITGLLVAPRDVTSLADAIQHLVDNGDLRRKMGRAGRSLAIEAFDIRNVIEAHLATYESLLAAPFQSTRGASCARRDN